ncbi:hypothetical protein [Nocardioides sp. Arc9.136]|uniref:hypothetical protein n=1 Tax=Nocardioides sp. Arc9.136 TaxID=2996826 RepID=UPI0026666336|nr:hypothetical protein [Nocardioides sp. Arc9.136]WKN48227.1 hypothetical protein OSR43_19620 [Nocardioides sp. Arc9.136]
MTSPTADVPLQVLAGPRTHGVVEYAAQLAAALGARTLVGDADVLDGPVPDGPVHVHFTERLLGPTAATSVRRVVGLCHRAPTTVTLHDVPQPWASEERVCAYAEVVHAAAGWAVSSHHEADLLRRALARVGADHDLPPGTVVHLPVVGHPVVGLPVVGHGERPAARPGPEGPATLAALGFVYPDKGHRELLQAATELRARGREVDVVCLGAPVPGHEDLLDELHRRARAGGVGLTVTGWLPDDELAVAMARVGVPVSGHRHLSASASVNRWLAVGRRPLLLDGPYAREMDALRPGAHVLHDDAGLVPALERALDDPASTWLPDGVVPAPDLAAAARQYAAWWASVHRTVADPVQPVFVPFP